MRAAVAKAVDIFSLVIAIYDTNFPSGAPRLALAGISVCVVVLCVVNFLFIGLVDETHCYCFAFFIIFLVVRLSPSLLPHLSPSLLPHLSPSLLPHLFPPYSLTSPTSVALSAQVFVDLEIAPLSLTRTSLLVVAPHQNQDGVLYRSFTRLMAMGCF